MDSQEVFETNEIGSKLEALDIKKVDGVDDSNRPSDVTKCQEAIENLSLRKRIKIRVRKGKPSSVAKLICRSVKKRIVYIPLVCETKETNQTIKKIVPYKFQEPSPDERSLNRNIPFRRTNFSEFL